MVDIFRDLDDEAVEVLAKNSCDRSFSRGQCLICEGEDRSCLIVIKQGHVKIHRDATFDKRAVIAIRAQGDVLGELSLIDRKPTSASVTVLDEVKAATISGTVFSNLLSQNLALSTAMMHLAISRLRDATETVSLLRKKNVSDKLAWTLIRVATSYGKPASDGIHLPPFISMALIADMVGNSREEVSRAFTRLRNDGFVKRCSRTRQLVIVDANGLGI